jgi:hypothetical protein
MMLIQETGMRESTVLEIVVFLQPQLGLRPVELGLNWNDGKHWNNVARLWPPWEELT